MSDEDAPLANGVTISSRKKFFVALLTFIIAGAALYGILVFRKHAVNDQVEVALAGETGAKTAVYRRTLLGGDDIVFDVQSVSGEMSMVDMTRMFLKTAEGLKDQKFNRVYLAYQGREKFYLEGAYFQQIGEEREWQNPVYTIRTLPENVRKLDGSPAFETWTGGLLGVMGGQMEDNNSLHKQWWVDDTLAEM